MLPHTILLEDRFTSVVYTSGVCVAQAFKNIDNQTEEEKENLHILVVNVLDNFWMKDNNEQLMPQTVKLFLQYYKDSAYFGGLWTIFKIGKR